MVMAIMVMVLLILYLSDPVGHCYLLCPPSDRSLCDPVFIRNPHSPSESAIFTGIHLILHVFGETPWLTSVCEYWDNTAFFRLISVCRVLSRIQSQGV